MNSGYFNEDQNDYMRQIEAMPPETRCWCGWYPFGQCSNPSCPKDKTCADKLAQRAAASILVQLTAEYMKYTMRDAALAPLALSDKKWDVDLVNAANAAVSFLRHLSDEALGMAGAGVLAHLRQALAAASLDPAPPNFAEAIKKLPRWNMYPGDNYELDSDGCYIAWTDLEKLAGSLDGHAGTDETPR